MKKEILFYVILWIVGTALLVGFSKPQPAVIEGRLPLYPIVKVHC